MDSKKPAPGPGAVRRTYYHEYQPSRRARRRHDLMHEARFNVIRVGESVWSTSEPEIVVFDLVWLQPVLGGAHARGIRVILGTPTYAAAVACLPIRINVHDSTGQQIGSDARQEINYTQPAFLFHAEQLIRRIIAPLCDHPGR